MWWRRTAGDEQIIRSVLLGERERFGVLVDRYLPVVQAIARAQGSPPGEVEDVAQETFLKAYLTLDQLRERGRFGSWLAVIARNQAIRMGKQRTQAQQRAEAWAAEAPDRVAPDTGREELFAGIREQIGQLEAQEREVILLYYFAGKNSREIAAITELSEPAVRKRLQRARQALGTRLLEQMQGHELGRQQDARQKARILTAVLGTATVWQAAEAGALAGGAVSGGLIAAAWGAGATKAVAALVVVAAAGVGLMTLIPPNEETVSSPETTATSEALEVREDVLAALPEPVAATPEDAPPVQASVTEEAGGRIRLAGRVVHADGTPVPHALAKGACWGSKSPDARTEAVSDAEGRFVLEGLEPCETYLVWAEKEGYVRIKQDKYALTQARPPMVTYTLYRAGSVAGRLVNALGAGVPERPVTGRNLDVEGTLWTVTADTDAQGNFVLEGMTPGNYALASVEQHAWSNELKALEVTLAEGKALTNVRVPYEEGAVLEGRVTDREGNALSGVFVQVHSGSWNPRNAYTDAEGRYRLDQLPEGEASISVSKQGYQGQQQRLETTTPDADFVLERRGRVSGRVLDATTSEPISNFEVQSVEGATATVGLAQERAFQQVEDAEGRFSIDEVALNTATITARAEGYQAAFEVVSLAAEEHLEGVTLQLAPGLTLEGRVLADGAPASGAYVFPGPPMYVPPGIDKQFLAQRTAEVAKAVSGLDGTFTLPGLSAGKQTLSAWHPELGSGTLNFVLEASGAEPEVILELSLGSTIRGVVRVQGEAREGIPVMATGLGGMGMPHATAMTDAQGNYSLEGVPAGPASVTAVVAQPGTPLGGRRLRQDIEVVPGEQHVDFDFPGDTGTIAGRVVAPDDAETTGMVQCEVVTATGLESSMAPLQAGGFTLVDVPTGTATVLVTLMEMGGSGGPGNASMRSQTVEVLAGEIVEIEVVFSGSAQVQGQVGGLRPGEHGMVMLIEGEVLVEAFELSTLAALSPLVRGSAMPGPGGAYSLGNVEPGDYTLLAVASASNGPDVAETARFATVTVSVGEAGLAGLDFDLE